MKFLVILGDITFLNPQTDNETKAIINTIESVVIANSSDEAGEIGENYLSKGGESYLIPQEYNGGIEFSFANIIHLTQTQRKTLFFIMAEKCGLVDGFDYVDGIPQGNEDNISTFYLLEDILEYPQGQTLGKTYQNFFK